MSAGNGNGHAPTSDDADYSDPEIVRAKIMAMRSDVDATSELSGKVLTEYTSVATRIQRIDERTMRIEALLEPIAVRIGRLDQEREVTVEHVRKARRQIAELQLADRSHREKFDSFHDEAEETGRRAVVTAEQAAKVAAKTEVQDLEHKLAVAESAKAAAELTVLRAEERERSRYWVRYGVVVLVLVVGGLLGFSLPRLLPAPAAPTGQH